MSKGLKVWMSPFSWYSCCCFFFWHVCTSQGKVSIVLEMRVKVGHRGLTNPVTPAAHAHCKGQGAHRKLLIICNDRNTSFLVNSIIYLIIRINLQRRKLSISPLYIIATPSRFHRLAETCCPYKGKRMNTSSRWHIQNAVTFFFFFFFSYDFLVVPHASITNGMTSTRATWNTLLRPKCVKLRGRTPTHSHVHMRWLALALTRAPSA